MKIRMQVTVLVGRVEIRDRWYEVDAPAGTDVAALRETLRQSLDIDSYEDQELDYWATQEFNSRDDEEVVAEVDWDSLEVEED